MGGAEKNATVYDVVRKLCDNWVMEEEFTKLDQVDLAQANRHVARWQSVLAKMRNADLLGELVDYQLRTGSQGALKVLLSLKDLHSLVSDGGLANTERK